MLIRQSQDIGKKNQQEVKTPEVSTISTKIVKLPPFWKENVELWFAQVEAGFDLHNIRRDSTKYRHTVVHLDKDSLALVGDIILQPPNDYKYGTLKNRMLCTLGETNVAKMRKLLSKDIYR